MNINRKTAERREKLKEILMTTGAVVSNEAATAFSVSSETIRKDLLFLEEQGFAKKSHGGAVFRTDYMERPFDLRNNENMELKTKVAEKALEYIPEKGVILLDAGSTTLLLARYLQQREGLTIITNSMSVCNVLSSSKNYVYITGGQAKGTTLSLVGLWACNCLETISIDMAFMGTSGFQNFSGPTVESFPEAELKKKVLERSTTTFVLCDSSKSQTSALAQYALWSEIDYLITDEFIETERLKQIQQATNVILVS